MLRRIIRFGSEDIGFSDSNALNLAINVYNVYHYLGIRECNIHLAEEVIYMSIAPKSNSCEIGYRKSSFNKKILVLSLFLFIKEMKINERFRIWKKL